MAESIEQKIVNLSKESGVLLIISPDRIRKARACSKACKTFIGSEESERFKAVELTAKNIRDFSDSLQNLSLFSTKRCVILEGVDELPASLNEQFLKILKQDLTDILLIVTATKLLKSSQIYTALKKNVVELPKLEKGERLNWIKKELSAAGIKQFSPNIPSLIESQAEESLDEAFSMIEKLALFIGDDLLSEEAFFTLFREVPNPGEFDLIDALQQKRLLDAEVLLQQLINGGKNQFMLLSIIYKGYLQALQIRLLLDQGKPPAAIQRLLGINSSWVFNKYLTLAKTSSAIILRKKIALLLRADTKLKNVSLGPEYVLGELLRQLAA